MSEILNVKDLTVYLNLKKQRLRAVDAVSFSLEKGKTLAVVGESGSGKSLTALALLRILPEPPALPPEGQALFAGKDLFKLSEKEMRHIRGRKISMIFQNPMSALNPVYTIGDQLLEIVELHLDLYGEEAEEKIIRSLESVGLASPEKRIYEYPHQLSGGMKQRVMIAMALICEPEILIADEPTTALDVTIQLQILDLIKELQEKNGMAVILITHDMGVVAEVADDVLVMYASQVVESGSCLDIFDHMSHPYTQALFRSKPSDQNLGKRLETIPGMVPPIHRFPKGCHFHPRCTYTKEICKGKAIPNHNVSDKHLSRCVLKGGLK